MAFHHRKLLNESLVDPLIPPLCKPVCDSTNGVCSITCNFPIPPPPVYDIRAAGKSYKLSLFLSISLAILATTFVFFTFYTIYKFYSLRRRWRRPPQAHREPSPGDVDFLDEGHGPVVDHPIWYIRTVGLQPSVIGSITIVRYKSGDGLIEGTDCAVCLNEFRDDEMLRLLPKCSHAFHLPCIDTWLRSHTNCPVCRAGILINTTALPSREAIVPISEERRVGVSGSTREVGSESESEASEVRIGIEEEDEPFGLDVDENLEQEKGNSGEIGGLDGIQPIRRSVSLDFLSASVINTAVANAFPPQSDPRTWDDQLAGVKESKGVERPMQTGTSSVKRSLSCSARVFLSRYSSRNQS